MVKHEHDHPHSYNHIHTHQHKEGMEHEHEHVHGPDDHKLTHMAVEDGSLPAPAMPGNEAPQGPRYPWGLKVEVTAAEMKKMGMEQLPAPDQELCMECRCKVVASSTEGTPRFTLQITHMDLMDENESEESPEKERDEQYKSLFGNPQSEG